MKNLLVSFMCFLVIVYTNILTSICIQNNSKAIEAEYKLKINILSWTLEQKNEKIKSLYNLIDFMQDPYEKIKIASEQELLEDVKAYIAKYYKKSSPFAASIAENVIRHSKKQELPVPVILAVIETESEFKPMAISRKGAKGLMQVMPKVWNLENTDLHNIGTGIEKGSNILRYYLNTSDQDMEKALFKYVGGDPSYYKKVYVNLAKFQIYRSLNK